LQRVDFAAMSSMPTPSPFFSRRLFLHASVVLTSLPQVAFAQGDTLRIGHSGPLTGSNKDLGEDVRDGALACFKAINDAGGINGRKLELLTLDDGNDAARAGENAKKLIADGALALFGYASATLSRPALPLVEAAKIPFFAPFTGAESMRVFNRHVYNIRASYADELNKIVQHYASLGSKTFAVVYYDDAVGKENLAVVERALQTLQLKSAGSVALNRATPDIASGVQAITAAKPDVVIQTTLYKASADMIKAVKAKGGGMQFVNTSFASATALAAELGKDGVGLAVSTVVPPFTRRSVPIVAEYLKQFTASFPKETPSFTSLESYIAAKVLAEGIKRAGKSVTRESLLTALDGIGSLDVGGYTVSFSAGNHNGSRFVDIALVGREGKFTY
jgi:branched-chain amino acid transport system substrate-binding protein